MRLLRSLTLVGACHFFNIVGYCLAVAHSLTFPPATRLPEQVASRTHPILFGPMKLHVTQKYVIGRVARSISCWERMLHGEPA